MQAIATDIIVNQAVQTGVLQVSQTINNNSSDTISFAEMLNALSSAEKPEDAVKSDASDIKTKDPEPIKKPEENAKAQKVDEPQKTEEKTEVKEETKTEVKEELVEETKEETKTEVKEETKEEVTEEVTESREYSDEYLDELLSDEGWIAPNGDYWTSEEEYLLVLNQNEEMAAKTR